MKNERISRMLNAVDSTRLSNNLFYLSKDPLPFRKLNFTLPGHQKSTLHEADDFISRKLECWDYQIGRDEVNVQAYRCDDSKPKAHQYGRPEEGDPWYKAYNLYGKRKGGKCSEEIILVCAHKDSQSWVDSPGAYDNAVGTVALLEMARFLADYPLNRSLWFLFCNEEHTPWTSITAAENAKRYGDDIIAVFNTDSLGGKPREALKAGRKTNATLYTKPEGKQLADLMCQVNEDYSIGLQQEVHKRKQPGDDDGSFIKAGFPAAIINVGSHPYGDPNYHRETDVPEEVDIENVTMATKAILAAIMTVDQDGLKERK